MTQDAGSQDTKEYPVYIPPTAGPGTQSKPLPETKKGDDWSGLVIMVLGFVIVIAGFQLFFTVMQLINTWIADELVPVFTAAFDIILIVGGIWLIRKYFLKK
ncbi:MULTISPECIES: hypothetical protein [unclassified Methanoregula]|uniref:hypothetical protein n=1 Tax=unclassified Methanoregula TaxID=2649730 RepID=UPI0009C42EE3|nr:MULTISPECIES: hypothetical protein [unclassified Methanoregula]OPX63163.1 MAG: hypothetical protein A4E33_01846 [Methanoregula sp. PtaB.Bin085]OPY33463.1 MAG: hypothetical protein A4E34_01786 [Methanoregula sp. PtaU1.Bin006]